MSQESLCSPLKTKTKNSPPSPTTCPLGSPEATNKLWLCPWQVTGGVCWATEPKPRLPGRYDGPMETLCLGSLHP